MFEEVQIELERNKHASARNTADEEYLLTTKLFCGKCGAMMVAQAGTSQTKKVYRYYACVRQKKHKCNKKIIKKQELEDFVVNKTMEMLKDSKVVDCLAKILYNLQHAESTVIPNLERQQKNKTKKIDNIVTAIQKGYATQTLLERLSILEQEKIDIEKSIEKENTENPVFTKEQYKMALNNYGKINIDTIEGKKRIINTFINSIYAYDDHIKIVYNSNGKEEKVTLEEIKSSTQKMLGEP